MAESVKPMYNNIIVTIGENKTIVVTGSASILKNKKDNKQNFHVWCLENSHKIQENLKHP